MTPLELLHEVDVAERKADAGPTEDFDELCDRLATNLPTIKLALATLAAVETYASPFVQDSIGQYAASILADMQTPGRERT